MIKIFKRPGCVYCPQVMKLYDHWGVSYEVSEAEGPDYEELSKLYGFSVPLVYNDENKQGMTGYNIGRLKEIAGLTNAV